MDNSNYNSIIWLSQGKYAIVDNEDYEFLNQWKWHLSTNNSGRRYARRSGLKREGFGTTNMCKALINVPQGFIVDHINRNALDNRRCNLRIATTSQNNFNKGKKEDGNFAYKGIHKPTYYTDKWRAQLKFNNKAYVSPLTTSIEQAARYYDDLALKYHGKFAVTNVMLGLLPPLCASAEITKGDNDAK